MSLPGFSSTDRPKLNFNLTISPLFLIIVFNILCYGVHHTEKPMWNPLLGLSALATAVECKPRFDNKLI